MRLNETTVLLTILCMVNYNVLLVQIMCDVLTIRLTFL